MFILCLVLLTIAGAALAYILGQGAVYFVVRIEGERHYFRYVTAYNVRHLVAYIAFVILVAFVTMMAMVSFGFEWFSSTPIYETWAHAFVKIAIYVVIMMAEWLIVVKFFIAGNRVTRKFDLQKDEPEPPLKLENFDSGDIVFLSQTLRYWLSEANKEQR